MGRVASVSETGGEVWAGVLNQRLNATDPPDLGFASATLPIKGGKAQSGFTRLMWPILRPGRAPRLP